MATSGKAPAPAGYESPRLRHLEVVKIRNGRPRIEIPITGRLRPYEKIDVCAEISEKVLRTSKPFKEGLSYRKGEVLIRIDGEEMVLNLHSQKSA